MTEKRASQPCQTWGVHRYHRDLEGDREIYLRSLALLGALPRFCEGRTIYKRLIVGSGTHGFRHPVSIAPMMKRTDDTLFHAGDLKHALLYTEMVTTGALIHGPRERVQCHADEHPISLQLGGDDPNELRLCARMAEDAGYDEVNLNVGCQVIGFDSQFGACLMKRPERVAEAVVAMKAEVNSVTVKHRIGVDDLDQYEDMLNLSISFRRPRPTDSRSRPEAWLQEKQQRILRYRR